MSKALGFLEHTVKRECSNSLAQAMTIIKQWVDWKPHYVLADNSSIKQLAIQKVFRGPYIGEQEVI